MKHRLLFSAMVLVTAMTAMAVPSDNITSAPHRVGQSVKSAPLHVGRTADKPFLGIQLKTLRDVNDSQSPFTTRNVIRKPSGIRQASYKGASSYSMPAYGVVVYSDAWNETGISRTGIYEIPTFGTPSSLQLINENPYLAGLAGAVYADGKFFSAVPETYSGQVTDMTYYVFDAETWQQETSMQGDPDFFATCMTYDPTSEKIFGCFINSQEQYYYFGSFDLKNFTVEEIKNYNVEYGFYGIAASPNGNLYGITDEGMFCSIDKKTGNVTEIKHTGIRSSYMTSATIDAKTGKMYYIATTGSASEMYEINTATGDASVIYQMPGNEEVLGMYIPVQEVANGAPAVAQSLSADFSGGSLSGKVNFTAPLLNYNNIPGTGDLTYSVFMNGTLSATGSTAYGATVSADVTVPASGEYTIAVAFSNAAGQGPLATIHAFIGHDSPTSVSNVSLTYSNGNFLLTWDAPKSVNGGFIDPDEITYTITRYPDNVVAAQAHKGTSFSEAIEEPSTQTKYSYSVAATYDGVTSAPVMSNIYALGSFVPPFQADFNQPSALEEFTIIDANNDGITWEYVNGEIKITYNSSEAANDYLVLPPMKLQSGKTYALSFDVKAQWDQSVEKVAVYVGDAPTAEALTTELLAPTNVTWDSYRTREVFFVPETTGTYFFAIKGCSEPDRFYLCIDNLYLSDAMNAGSPAAPTAFTVVPGTNGAYTATLTFTAPATTINGQPLETIDHMEITRNGETIGSVEATPGSVVTYTDNNPVNGNNDYGVAAVNAAGKGAEVHATVYVGVYAPEKVETLTAFRSVRNAGEVNLGWDAVTKDVEGNSLKPSQVKYVLYRWMQGITQVVAEGLSSTSYKDVVCDNDAGQQFIYYAVSAYTEGGESENAYSDLVAVGAPYELPYMESFPNGSMSHIFGVEDDELNPGSWINGNDQSIEGIKSQDNDNGFLIYYSQWPGASSTVYSGQILLENTTNPELTFYYYNHNSTNEFDVQLNYGNGLRTVKNVKLGGEEGWEKCTISLSAYIGQEIQYAIAARITSTTVICFDNFRIGSRVDHNLMANVITATPTVNAGDDVTVNVTVMNDGTYDAEAYSVELYRDGQLAATTECSPLAAEASATVTFTDHTNALSPDEIEYHAVIRYAEDEIADDNTTNVATVSVRHPDHPAASGLTAVSNDKNVDLAWYEPDFDAVRKTATVDGAEDYRSFSIGLSSSELAGDRIGDWTMVDVDGLSTYGIGMPGSENTYQYANATKPMAFQVFSVEDAGFQSPRWESYSGKKMFVCFASVVKNGQGNDDWMISPELSGEAQMVSFFAKSADVRYGADMFEVYYSLGGTEISEFVKLGEASETTESWAKYSYELPEGARHFAIRCISFDRFAFCVDDVTFISADAPVVELSLLGYNVYRNGVKINDDPVEETSYSDADVPAGNHTYHVTALYTIGESRPSNGASVSHNSGIDDIFASGVTVTAADGFIIIGNAEGLSYGIHTADGRTLAAGTAAGTVKTEVTPGIYVVTVGGNSMKIAVR